MFPPLSRPLAGIALVLLGTARAGAQPVGLDPVVVTGARAEEPLSSARGDVTVIDRDAIERAGQGSVTDLLQWAPGVDVASNGGPQSISGVFLRGANSTQTVYLVDGLRVGSATAGGAGINAVGLADIERIEILRGPASSLYGADAIGGVINLVTRRPSGDVPLRLSGSVGAGSWNTYKADAGLSGATGPWRYALSVGHARSDGYSAAKPDEPGGQYNPDRDGYRQDHASGRLGFTWAAGQELEASFLRSRMWGRVDSSPTFDDVAVQRIESYSLASNNRINDRWTSRLRVGRTVDDSVSLYAPQSWDPTGRAAFRTRQTQFTWQNDIALAAGQSLSVAAERREEEVDATTVFTQGARNTNSLTAVYRLDAARHHVQANGRYDHVGGYGSRTTGGLSYAFDLDKAWQVTTAASTGFRLPTFNDLYYPGFGNPNLRPETSRNVEAGLRYRADGTEASVIAYRNHVENLVIYQNTTTVNKDALLKGVTLTAAKTFGSTAVRASLDLADPKDENTGETLSRRARKVVKVAAEHRIGAWRVGAEWLASGDRVDKAYNASTFATETYRLGGYSLLNLVASYDLTRQAQLQVRWNNVTDKDYELARGYTTPGSNVFVNLAYRP